MNLDRFPNPPERSMSHEKPESYPDDYRPQCECNRTKPAGVIRTDHWFAVGYAERKPDGEIRTYVEFGKPLPTFEAARKELQIMRTDYNRRGIATPSDEFCVVEHTETFYLV